MTTPKKKHLIELMIEAGVKWPEGAEYAAQDKRNLRVNFYRNGKPNIPKGENEWLFHNCEFMGSFDIVLPSLCRNWNQTIVTRERYAEALAANVNEPVEQVDTQQKPQYCTSVMRQMPDSTIEQLTAEYHTLAAEAECLQNEADATLKLADEALIALQKAGELIGLVISVGDFQKDTEQHQQPIITDWRDLRVGDVIECTSYNDKRDDPWPGGWATQNIGTQQVVSKINDSNGKISIKDQDSGYAFKFIRRP